MSRAVNNPKRKKGRVGGGGGESGGVYDTQKFHNNECELLYNTTNHQPEQNSCVFLSSFCQQRGRKKGICLLLDDEKVQYYPQTSVVNKPSIYDHFPVGSRLFFYFIFLRPPSGAMDCFGGKLRQTFFLVIVLFHDGDRELSIAFFLLSLSVFCQEGCLCTIYCRLGNQEVSGKGEDG